MIEVTGVSKFYGSKTGVKGLTFRVNSGEILGLLGPNGAGKSTTLRMLTGYLTPSTGSSCVDGNELWENPGAVRAKLGYLPDKPPLYREMTVRAYIDFAAALRGVPAAARRERVAQALEATGLKDVGGRLLGNLSRGYQQRVGLAQAIVHDPAVLVLDEPTTGLDPIQVSEIRALILRLGAERTVILSSHILPEVQLLCQRVLVMDRGRVLADDRPDLLSQRFQQSRRYRVRVFGEPEQAAAIARGISGVTRAVVAGAVLEIDSASDMDICPELFYRLAAARLPLLELTPISLSLEDVFLRLITDEHAAGGGVA
jgi:ABC-2 type transport system ATP-binding protein